MKDLKEIFHVTLRSIEGLRKIATSIHNTDALQFIFCAETFAKIVEPLIMDFARSVEEIFALKGFAQEVSESKDAWTFRYLHYFGDRAVGDETALPHVDKGGFTLHLFESCPGLQYLNFDKTWQEMPVSDRETVIIPGLQLQFKSKNELKALCHRVVATEYSAEKGRYSMVCFIPLKQTLVYNKAGSGRTQEFAPGFNYEMSYEDISKIFI